MDNAHIISFLKDLKANNNRKWFDANKDRYIKANEHFLQLVKQAIDGIGQFDPDIVHLDPKKCTYRIYRDIRFSKDKTPYKTHFGAEMAPEGRRSGLAGYYFHIQPGESMIAGGVWHPSKENLSKIRQEIDYNSRDLNAILESSGFKRVYGSMHGDKLKKAPKGYDPDHEDIEFLKHKDFLAYTILDDKVVKSDDYMEIVIKNFKILKPFNDFLNVAVT